MLRYNVLTSAIFSHRTPAGLGPLIPDYAYVAEALQPRFQLDASPMWAITFDAAFFFEQYGVQHDRQDSSWLCNRITLSSQAILFSFKDARCCSLARTKAIKTGDLSLVLLLSKLLLGVPLNPLLPPLRALVNILSSAVDGIESVYEKNGTTFPDVNAPYTLSPLEHNPQPSARPQRPTENITTTYTYQMYMMPSLRYVVETSIADVLNDRDPKGMHVAEIAKKINAREPALIGRVLRYMASRHCFKEVAPDYWNEHAPEYVSKGKIQFQHHNFFRPNPSRTSRFSHLRAAAQPSTKLIVFDHIILHACPDPSMPAESVPHAPWPMLANLGHGIGATTTGLDIHMLSLFGAQERTVAEFVELGQLTGWKLEKGVPGATGTLVYSAA
ncbi:hypothetical protein BDV98DRAFT_594043 [Pterulicium gracile]|uniref:O-methyltransferase domain-containing protein n=1 Tax=Pterulicium gracile TaxID=1884261 RepID=A0A5C3QG60_9AGAR|nr:hypothetical protein BDV98DRAFT_594043 [Pterula gracilis]